MHYYQHHIGDFIRDTARLSDSQCMTYLRLLWLYYESEQPLTSNINVLSLKVGGDEAEIFLLLEAFFVFDGNVYRHIRCDKEIANYRKLSEGGKQGAAKRWLKDTDSPPITTPLGFDSHPNSNHKPITNNHKPNDKNISAFAPPIPDELLKDWLEVRKAKRAGKLTKTAWTGLANQAAKAGISPEQAVRICCERGWQSFNASWNWKGVDEPPKPAAHVMRDTSQYALKPIDKNAWKTNLEAAKLGMKMKGDGI